MLAELPGHRLTDVSLSHVSPDTSNSDRNDSSLPPSHTHTFLSMKSRGLRIFWSRHVISTFAERLNTCEMSTTSSPSSRRAKNADSQSMPN